MLDIMFKGTSEIEKRFEDKIEINFDLKRTLVSFQANKKIPGYRWYKFKEGYSYLLVDYVLEKLQITSGKLTDPFAGSGTSLFAAGERGIDSVGIEFLPIGQEIIEVRKNIFKHGKAIADFLEKYLHEKWSDLNLTVEGGVKSLSTISSMVETIGDEEIIRVLKPDKNNRELLERIDAMMPTALPCSQAVVATRKNLVDHRNKRTTKGT